MIELVEISKYFSGIKVVDKVSFSIQEKGVYGILGANGAGKSTILRMMSGILKADNGKIFIDNEEVYENENVKKKLFYIPNESYFFPRITAKEIISFYKNLYIQFDEKRFYNLLKSFELPLNYNINSFSKGMKKQLSIILGICSNAKYLFCDEVLDGLDACMRKITKSLLVNEIEERKLTPIIVSHNLREIEDICDQIGIFFKGKLITSQNLDRMKNSMFKVQCVLDNDNLTMDYDGIEIIKKENRGNLNFFTIRGSYELIANQFKFCKSEFVEIYPMSLEEIFISEMEGMGYDGKKLVF